MTASDRIAKVARILGWEPRWPHRSPKGGPDAEVLSMKCAECGEWVDPIDRTSFCSVPWNPHWERDGCRRGGTPYDVDDLLAWLCERFGEAPSVFDVYDCVLGDGTNVGAGWIVEASKWNPESFRYDITYSEFGPTLLAALEAAVLAVAGEDEQ